jgi:hypothetical protein
MDVVRMYRRNVAQQHALSAVERSLIRGAPYENLARLVPSGPTMPHPSNDPA